MGAKDLSNLCDLRTALSLVRKKRGSVNLRLNLMEPIISLTTKTHTFEEYAPMLEDPREVVESLLAGLQSVIRQAGWDDDKRKR